MSNLIPGLFFLLMGIIGHLILRKSYDCSMFVNRILFNQRGEVDAGVKEVPGLTQEQQTHFDKVLQSRVARERDRFGDYEDLKKFKTEFETKESQKQQDELIKQKKFEEAENTYKTKINEYGQIVSKKDSEIQDLKISHALSNEVNANNGYVEESIALLKGNVVMDAAGNIKVKGKDTNGIDVEMSLTDGVKKFLEQKPHLVKSTHTSGAGTGAGNGSGAGAGAGSGQGEDLNSLNAQLAQAMKGTDLKLRSELRGKISKAMSARNIHR